MYFETKFEILKQSLIYLQNLSNEDLQLTKLILDIWHNYFSIIFLKFKFQNDKKVHQLRRLLFELDFSLSKQFFVLTFFFFNSERLKNDFQWSNETFRLSSSNAFIFNNFSIFILYIKVVSNTTMTMTMLIRGKNTGTIFLRVNIRFPTFCVFSYEGFIDI